MKLTNDVVHVVVGDSFVIDLHDLANDKATVKFMVTKDKEQICYLRHLSSSMENQGCEHLMCWLIFLKLRKIL